jgi:hypothetical protein
MVNVGGRGAVFAGPVVGIRGESADAVGGLVPVFETND